MNLSKGEQDANYDPFLVQPRDSKEENKQRLMQATWLRRSQNFSSAIFTPKKQKLAKVSQREQERATRDSQTDAYLERDHRVAFMEKMFDGSYHSEMTHPRTGKRVKRMYDVIQDDIVPDTTYTLCTFTDNPADRVRLNKRKHLGPELQGRQAATLDGTDRGILRPFSNPHDPNDSYLIWFLPNEQGTERLLQHKQDPTDNSIFDGTVDYYNVREFVYEDANTSRQKSALITMHGDKAYLKPIPSRMRCRQRRKAVSVQRTQNHTCVLMLGQFRAKHDNSWRTTKSPRSWKCNTHNNLYRELNININAHIILQDVE